LDTSPDIIINNQYGQIQILDGLNRNPIPKTTFIVCPNTGGTANVTQLENYTYFGNISQSNQMVFFEPNSIYSPLSHYQITVIYGIILFGNWTNSTVVRTTINSTSISTTATDSLSFNSISGNAVRSAYPIPTNGQGNNNSNCSLLSNNSNSIIFVTITKSYSHYDTDPFTITVSLNDTNVSLQWGVK
jgi:hypothetical protein